MRLRTSAKVFSLDTVFDKGTSSIGFFTNKGHNSNCYVTIESKDGKHYSEFYMSLNFKEGKRSIENTLDIFIENHTGHKYTLPKYVKQFVCNQVWSREDSDIALGLNAVEEASHKMKETNDCTVKAIALSTGVTYEVAHAACKIEGRKEGHGICYHPIMRAIERVGGKILSQSNRHEYRIGGIKNTIDYKKCKTQNTVKNLAKKLGAKQLTFNRLPEVVRKDRNYVVMNAGHAIAVVEGKILDWSAGSKMFVTEIIEIAK